MEHGKTNVYQCNRKTRSTINHVPNFAQSKTKSKFVKSRFLSRNENFEYP